MIITRDMGTVLPKTTMSAPVYMDAKKAPFKLYGMAEPYIRLPESVAGATSADVLRLHKNSAGMRVRFRTTSSFLAVHADFSEISVPGSCGPSAAAGFDMYFKENGKYVFKGLFTFNFDEENEFLEKRIKGMGSEWKDITLFLPLHTSITNLYMGLEEGSEIDYPSDYKYEKPIVFYGSSIVHGNASKPSNIYTAMLSNRLDTNYINLGFGGAAKAEKAIMEYISTLDMSIFVYDYDHNAPTVEYLEQTHYAGYKIFREKHPTTPVIFASKPDYHTRHCGFPIPKFEDNEPRRQIIENSYKRAIAEGDKNVYFVDGSKMYPENYRDECTSDGCHPNDLGYFFMANAFEEVIKELL